MFSDAVVAGSGAEGYASSQRTVFSRDVAFPLVDAFLPVNRARVPVPGYNKWPGPANILGKRYYGLAGGADVKRDAKQIGGGHTAMAGIFDDFGIGTSGFNPGGTMPPVINPGGGGEGDGGGGGGTSIWDRIFGTIQSTLPATISAITGRRDPGYYQQNQQGQNAPAGYYYNESGQLISVSSAQQALGGVGAAGAGFANSISNFVQQNPMLILGAGAAVLLLMTRPPGRR